VKAVNCKISLQRNISVDPQKKIRGDPSSPSTSTFPSLPLEVGSLNPAMGVGERCKLPQWGLWRSPAEIEFGAF